MEDPGIKLFGKKILLPESSKSINLPLISTSEAPEKDQVNPRSSPPKAMAESDNPKTPEKSDATNSQPKTLKKPDKILPCPRCSSMDTKFCYYNNYNVNQPRHFCKSCQRYWTAGGAMRNMPVGAGRRKNKNLTYQTEFSVSSVKPVTTSDSEVRVSWPWNSTIPIPAICPPIPFHPSTYWNCIPFLPPPSPSEKTLLGKHSRDDELFINPNDCEDDLKKRKNAVLIPKTLRIDDPDEAAKSSIWATLGIKNDNFKAFQDKGEEKKKPPVNTTSSSSVLQANPAAFSRSLCFQETV